MTAKELKDKKPEELTTELEGATKHLFDLRTQSVTEKLEDPSQVKKTRKTIARIKTIQKQRAMESAQK